MPGPLDNRWCPCGNPAAEECSKCHRMLCRWHHAFIREEDGAKLAPCCMPVCNATWWQNRKPEWRQSE